MTQFGKVIAILGVALAITGAAIWLLGRLGLRGLPGDLRLGGDNARISIPIVTCLVISIVLTIVINLVVWLARHFRG